MRLCWVPAIAVVMLLAASGVWLDRQFEEPGSITVPSLLRHLEARSVMAVLAHPDDEIQIAGLLADASLQQNIDSWTLTLTRGEAAVTRLPLDESADLASIRTEELHEFGLLLELDAQAILDYPDGGLRETEPIPILDDVVRHIRSWQPDIVVTFDAATGLTLHPDHLAAGGIARQAFDFAGDATYQPSLGLSHQPRLLVVVLAPRKMLRRFGGGAGQKIADMQPEAQYAIKVSRRLKSSGWAIHESQRHVIHEVFGMSPELLYLFWDKEHYAIVQDTAN